MKKNMLYVLLTVLLISTFQSVLATTDTELNLMPVPKSVELLQGQFRLDESLTIKINGIGGDRLYEGSTRALHRLAGRTGLFFSQDYITPDKNAKVDGAKLIINCTRAGMLKLNEDETYTLKINPDLVQLSAETDIGVLRGLETLLQLLDADEEGYFFPSVSIKDAPRFPWRGLMIDACRHFMPVDVVKRNLDGMAAVKLNVLHWHLSEDQGFRVESLTYPKLHELGSDGLYYSQAQIKDIIAYASSRGIRVMPEFDLPGHSSSWFVAYPELASAPGPYSIERRWGVFDPTFNPTSETTYKFLDKFFKEIAQLFPDDYLHIGGDENNGVQWDANPDIQKFMKKNNIPDNHALQSYFNQRLLKILTKYGKHMVGWEEILHPDMPKTIVIQSWRGVKSLIEAAEKGYQAILSSGYYIDLIQPTDYHYLNDPSPADIQLTDYQKRLILGGEAPMWAEFVTYENVDSRIWPRTAAIAERFWSPGAVNDVDDMYRRLEVVSFRLEELGLLHIKNKDMMLRRLTNNHDTQPLRTLLGAIEPVKEYRRNQLRQHTQTAPLTRVVDAATPDAKDAREFRKLIDMYIESADTTELLLIEAWLKKWKCNHGMLVEIIKVSPILREIETLSEDLSRLSTLGLNAISKIRGNDVPSNCFDSANELLTKSRDPRGQVELMVVDAVEKLFKHSNR